MSVNITELVIELTETEILGGAIINQDDADALWMVFTGALVFFMHAGFAMLEAGSIHKTSVANIMFKNIGTVSIGVISYWFLGYGFAYDVENDGEGGTTFIGADKFLGESGRAKAFWFFQMVFAATAATIVSGAVAGRIKLTAYFIIATALTSFIYPVVSHWIWDEGGFLSAFTDTSRLHDFTETPCGVIDFAGSGVVHMTGGVAAFWGALILGPRAGWTPAGDKHPPHNFALATLGTFILWFGWYGFNPGSTLVWDGTAAGQIAVTTTLAPGAACIGGILINKVLHKTWDLGAALNSVLAGLVAITAPCATVTPGAAVGIGFIASIVYYGASKFNRQVLKLDDPVDAVAVHGANGLFGLIAVALFSNDELLASGYHACDTDVGSMLVWQLLGALCIFVWVTAFAVPMFGILKATGQLKLTEEEQYDIDMTEHGATAYEKMD